MTNLELDGNRLRFGFAAAHTSKSVCESSLGKEEKKGTANEDAEMSGTK